MDTTQIPGVHTTLRRGEDTVIPNWALDAIERLILAADIRVLTFLTRHRQYRSNTYTTRQLAIALEIDLRTIQASTGRLIVQGLILGIDGHFCSSEASTRVQGVRKPSAKGLQKDSPRQAQKTDQNALPGSLKKGSDEERKEEMTKNPPTPQGEARNGTALGGQDQIAAQNSEPLQPPDGGAAVAAVADLPDPLQVPTSAATRRTEPATSTDKVPAARAAPSADHAMFGAVALACYGGHDGLTDITRSRIGKVGKSLAKAGYTAEDVGLIVAELRQEQWRDSITPSVIEAEAPAWRARQRGSLPARQERPHVLRFTPRPQTTEAANQQAAQRASDIYAALQEDTRAVF
ncbi:hypothetical protein E7T09_08480 [Deinococcus sp. KSM4-11]|uniref:hypothetical protein n=1 Tax=Deinococcus sp. KSM4-11 TaxID=2568654 RepID=UPI0010A4DCA9|nr:hypothetical protein [Deinococcus sp. KSM4-11]THF87182.1 hypothetical protein E7T09_08480 [Deinococcus sp. KSM4-11]